MNILDNPNLSGLTMSSFQTVGSVSVLDPVNIAENSSLSSFSLPSLFSAIRSDVRFNLRSNDLNSVLVNSLLSSFVMFDLPLSGGTIWLNSQVSGRGTTGQGITDAQTLRDNGNTVNVIEINPM